MLIPIFGTPSPLTYFISTVAQIICETVSGSCFFVTPISIEDVRVAWSERRGRSIVMQSEVMQKEVIDIFIDIGAPIYVISDDPVDVVIYVQESRGIDFRSALRFASQSLSSLSDLYAYGNVELIDISSYNLSMAELLERFLGKLKINLSMDQHCEVLRRIAARSGCLESETVQQFVLCSNPHARVPRTYSAPGGQLEQEIINKIITQYGVLLKKKARNTPIVWPREIFPDRDNLHQILNGFRPLLGPARILFGGHTLHLPSGDWTVLVDLEVAGNHSGNRLLSQVYFGEELMQTVTAELPPNGRFVYEMACSVSDAFYPVQVLVAIAEGAIEGEIALHTCEFRPREPKI